MVLRGLRPPLTASLVHLTRQNTCCSNGLLILACWPIVIRLRLVLYGVVVEGNVVRTIDDAFVYYHGAWIRISRRVFRRILRRYRIVDSRIVDRGVVEFLLERKAKTTHL